MLNDELAPPSRGTYRIFTNIIAIVVPLAMVMAVFLLFTGGVICSAQLDPSGEYKIAACDKDSIPPKSLTKIFATIGKGDTKAIEEYAEAVLVNSQLIAKIIELNRDKLKEGDFLVGLLADAKNLDGDDFGKVLNDKKYYSTLRVKLVTHLSKEVELLNQMLDVLAREYKGKIDQEKEIENYLNDRPLLRALRDRAINKSGLFRPIAKQFYATLPLKPSQPKRCFVNIPNAEGYINNFVKLKNNRTGKEAIGFTRFGIRENKLTPDGTFRMHVNSEQATTLDLSELRNHTGDLLSLSLIDTSTADKLDHECFTFIMASSETLKVELRN